MGLRAALLPVAVPVGFLGLLALVRMDEARDFADLPVLADAGEEAGCGNEELLAHLRKPGALAAALGLWA
jgi:hypothetical protein